MDIRSLDLAGGNFTLSRVKEEPVRERSQGQYKQSSVKFKATEASESPGEAPATKTAALFPDCWVRMKQTHGSF